MTDPHVILGVAPQADAAEIRQAWRARVRESHPDHGGDPAVFLAVQMAFRSLAQPAPVEPSPPVVVPHLGPPSVVRRWRQRRRHRRDHPRVI